MTMKETVRYFRKQLVEAWDLARHQWKPFAVALVAVALVYFLSVYVAPGWVTYLAIVPPALIVALTALPRVNDIGPEIRGLRWEARRIALILTGVGAVMMLGAPFASDPNWPAWRTVVIVWGFAVAWMTTPGMPPWDYYISGKYRFLTHPPDEPRSPLERILRRATGELDTEELMRRQAEWEAEQAKGKGPGTRRGDGVDP